MLHINNVLKKNKSIYDMVRLDFPYVELRCPKWLS